MLGSMVRVGSGRCVAVRVGSGSVAVRVGSARVAVRVGSGAVAVRVGSALVAVRVGSGAPFQSTTAPSTKRLPATCSVNAPIGTFRGVTAVSQGTGLRSVTRHDAAESGFLRLAARTVTCDPDTPDAGAVYLPVGST